MYTGDGLTKFYKNSANKFGRKTGFKIENEIEDQDQSIPKLIGILTQVFCTFGPNLVILAWTGDGVIVPRSSKWGNFWFEVKFDLEGQGQSPPKTIGILTKVFYTYGPNLVILAWTGDELSRGQASDYRTHERTDTQTDAGNDNTRRPKLASGKNQFNIAFVYIDVAIHNFVWKWWCWWRAEVQSPSIQKSHSKGYQDCFSMEPY